MVIIDVILVAVIIAAMVRGWQLGAIRQSIIATGLFLGFWLSVVAVPLLSPFLVHWVGRTALTLGIFAFLLAIIGGGFDLLAEKVKSQLTKRHHHLIDGGVGIAFGAVYAAILIWLAANVFMYGPLPWLATQIKQSVVVRTIDQVMPNPPSALVEIRQYIANITLPQPFAGEEPVPQSVASSATRAEVEAIMAKTSRSVVAVAGRGCGGISTGSGFVAADGVVVTNAHVIAGIPNPVVTDRNGRHTATVIYFNPDLDIALLKTTHLAGDVLPLTTQTQPRGTFGVVMGYPGGGGLVGGEGYVVNAITAVGRNIYNEGYVRRGLYTLSADVEPGNSGGPYIVPDGSVAGVVFARSESYANTGYAIRASEVAPILSQYQNSRTPVSTQYCAE